MVDNQDISIVVPVYGCDGSLTELYERVVAAVSRIRVSFELIFVDDCGPGRPWELINDLAQRDTRVIGLKLSRNFGQHNAILAGVDFARGNWIVAMDCDLQDQPEEIPRLWAKAQEGFDIVVGSRVKRKDNYLKRLCSLAYWRVFAYMTDQKNDATQVNFGIYSRKVIDEFKQMPEHSKFLTRLAKWMGFKETSIEVRHGKRIHGKSSYNLRRMFSLAIESIISFSNKPLKIFVYVGFIISLLALSMGFFLFLRYFSGHVAEGWTSLIVSMYFLSGMILFAIGVLGLYIGQIFIEIKGRPSYIVVECTSDEK